MMSRRTRWAAVMVVVCIGCGDDEGTIDGVFEPAAEKPCSDDDGLQNVGTLVVTNRTGGKQEVTLEASGDLEFSGKGLTLRDTLGKGETRGYPVSGTCGKDNAATGKLRIKWSGGIYELLDLRVDCVIPSLPPS